MIIFSNAGPFSVVMRASAFSSRSPVKRLRSGAAYDAGAVLSASIMRLNVVDDVMANEMSFA